MKKRKWTRFFAPVACILSGALLLLVACSMRETGHMKLLVVDAYTEAPVKGAVIILPEADLSAVSDENGAAYVYGIPVQPKGMLCETVPCSYGEATILAYAEGYLPFALFHAHIYKNRVRNGPTLYLFPNGTEEGIKATSMIESPEEEWVERLLAKYAP